MAAERWVNEFSVPELANTVCAYAKVTVLDGKLFPALAIAAEQRVSEF